MTRVKNIQSDNPNTQARLSLKFIRKTHLVELNVWKMHLYKCCRQTFFMALFFFGHFTMAEIANAHW